MTIASEILKAQNNLKDCYDACEVEGVVLPEEKNFDNLPALIEQALAPFIKPFKKPADWTDIRTDCPENSIALYAGHTADYSQYDNLGFIANCVGGYNVFIDGTQYGSTYASGSQCNITWSTSGIITGDDITTPVELKAHKIWICPAVEGNDITRFVSARVAGSSMESQGVVWAHFNLTNAIDISYAFNYPSIAVQSMLVAITAKNSILNFSGNLTWSINYNEKINYIPALNQSSSDYIYANQVFSSTAIKKIVIKNFKPVTLQSSFYNANSLTSINYKDWDLSKCKLVSLPSYTNYQNVDLTNNNVLTQFSLYGNSTKPATLKSLRVSNEAPFNGTAPQINVNYTGLDRAALVQLFEDLPYNVGYEVVGSPTIVDGVVSGFSANDYAYTTSNLTYTIDSNYANLEFVTRIKSDSLSSHTFALHYNTYSWISSGLGTTSSGKARFFIGRNSNGTDIAVIGTTSLTTSAFYYLKGVVKNNKAILLLSFDGQSWNEEGSVNLTGYIFNITGPVGIGKSTSASGNIFNGSIDLNETYIKVNGVPWFTGKAAMTKTCSIVGATGTADLTQEDKNIALNKGWSVTIS